LPTELVLETAEVRRLSPIESRIGLRFNFGHGKPVVNAEGALQ
jgi:hypothetical protein